VFVALSTAGAWSRGILRGFMAAAHEQDWTLLHYHPSTDLERIAREWRPAAAVVGPELGSHSLQQFASAAVISVTVDRSAEGFASVCVDEESVAAHAAEHLLATGLRSLTTFRFDDSRFSIAREHAFVAAARAGGARVAPGWGSVNLAYPKREDPVALPEWLLGLPKPCGIFTCTDGWARTVVRYAGLAGLRIPEDLALVGADNDTLECELISPALSSVIIPWRKIGMEAAKLVQSALLAGSKLPDRVVVPSLGVVKRRSSDLLAIQDPIVVEAVRWIRAHAEQRLTVPMVADAVGGGRQRIERRFRAALARTVQEEIRRAHVETAKRWLASSDASMMQIARSSGFTNAALLSVAFQREVGMPPSVYRRRVRSEAVSAEDD
jgi:LacI family transcriptional regulator